MIDKATAFVPGAHAEIRVLCDGKSLNADRFPERFLPVPGDRVILDGRTLQCVRRELNLSSPRTIITIELNTVA